MNPDLALTTFCVLPQGTLITVNQQSRNLRINPNMGLSKWPVNSTLRQTPPKHEEKKFGKLVGLFLS